MKRYMHLHVHCSIISVAKTWKQPKCPLTDERIKKMWNKYTMEYDSAIKRNATTWMDLEIIILSEISQRKTSII